MTREAGPNARKNIISSPDFVVALQEKMIPFHFWRMQGAVNQHKHTITSLACAGQLIGVRRLTGTIPTTILDKNELRWHIIDRP